LIDYACEAAGADAVFQENSVYSLYSVGPKWEVQWCWLSESQQRCWSCTIR